MLWNMGQRTSGMMRVCGKFAVLGGDIPNARTIEEKELDRVADEAAERVGKKEQRYDEGHSIFTK